MAEVRAPLENGVPLCWCLELDQGRTIDPGSPLPDAVNTPDFGDRLIGQAGQQDALHLFLQRFSTALAIGDRWLGKIRQD
jgi:hypothetical protein